VCTYLDVQGRVDEGREERRDGHHGDVVVGQRDGQLHAQHLAQAGAELLGARGVHAR